jgi:hypothetical protein
MCTLGGAEAMRTRLAEWQHVTGRATGRRPVAGGVSLTYDHDERVAVELARLAAAEFACCSFFEFTLGVGPDGMTFTVSGPAEVGEVIAALFGSPSVDPSRAEVAL